MFSAQERRSTAVVAGTLCPPPVSQVAESLLDLGPKTNRRQPHARRGNEQWSSCCNGAAYSRLTLPAQRLPQSSKLLGPCSHSPGRKLLWAHPVDARCVQHLCIHSGALRLWPSRASGLSSQASQACLSRTAYSQCMAAPLIGSGSGFKPLGQTEVPRPAVGLASLEVETGLPHALDLSRRRAQ